MFIRLSSVFSIFDRSGYNSEGSTLSTIEQNLRSHPSYIGTVPSRRFTWEESIEIARADDQETMVKVMKPKSTSTSAIIINYDKFRELYSIDFRRTFAPEPEPEVKKEENVRTNTHTPTTQDLPFPPSDGDDRPF
jgi:DNA primase